MRIRFDLILFADFLFKCHNIVGMLDAAHNNTIVRAVMHWFVRPPAI